MNLVQFDDVQSSYKVLDWLPSTNTAIGTTLKEVHCSGVRIRDRLMKG